MAERFSRTRWANRGSLAVAILLLTTDQSWVSDQVAEIILYVCAILNLTLAFLAEGRLDMVKFGRSRTRNMAAKDRAKAASSGRPAAKSSRSSSAARRSSGKKPDGGKEE